MLSGRPDANDAVAEAFEPATLVLNAQAGCARSFSALAEHYRPRLMSMLQRRYGVAPGDAEDLVQETLAKAFNKLAGLFTIAKHEAIDRHRRQRRGPRQVVFEADSVHAAECDAPTAIECRDEAENIWRHARALLSEPQYRATWLRFAENCDISEIARRMNRSRIGVRVLLHRARLSLAAAFAAQADNARGVPRKEN
jgi:RNA polymerase sigma factor (sigma-70 family)